MTLWRLGRSSPLGCLAAGPATKFRLGKFYSREYRGYYVCMLCEQIALTEKRRSENSSLYAGPNRVTKLIAWRGWLHVARPSRTPIKITATLGDGWNPIHDPAPILDAVQKLIQRGTEALLKTLQDLSDAQRQWAQQAWARTVVVYAVSVALFTAFINAWGLPFVNRRLPQLAQTVSVMLQRDVALGSLRWVAPTGILGLHPLASIGPITVGPGPTERSSATIERVSLAVNPLASVVRGRIVLDVRAADAEIHLRQADNFSWFGYPDDTTPSSRNFVPGLTQGNDDNNGGRGSRRGGSDGGQPSASDQGKSIVSKKRGAVRKVETAEMGISSSNFEASDDEMFLASVVGKFLERHAASSIAGEEAGAENQFDVDSTPLALSAEAVGPSTTSGTFMPLDALRDTASNGGVSAPTRGWRNLVPLHQRQGNPVARNEGGMQVTDRAEKDDSKQKQLAALNSIVVTSEGRRNGTKVEMKCETTESLDEAAALQTTMNAGSAMADRRAVDNAPSRVVVPLHESPLVGGGDTPFETIKDAELGNEREGDYLTLKVGQSSSALPHEKPLIPAEQAVARINSLPTLHIDLSPKLVLPEKREFAESQAAEQAWAAPPSAAATAINSVHPISVGEMESPPKRELSTSGRFRSFSDAVVDPATIRRQSIGSKALQQSRNWQPSRKAPPFTTVSVRGMQTDQTLVRSAVDSTDEAFSEQKIENTDQGCAAELSTSSQAGTSIAVESKVDALEGGTSQSNRNHAGKMHFTHPGYFPPSSGPSYTPAPPDAFAEKRAKYRAFVQQIIGVAAAQMQRSTVLGSIDLAGATLYGHIHGEEIPRKFENVTATVRFGPGYDALDVDIHADPHERDPASLKCTMLHPHAHRHLRDVTGRSASQAGGDDAASAPTTRDSANLGSHPTTGGHVQVLVRATGVVENDLGAGGPRMPSLEIIVRGRDLHAPLVERIIELPMDISAGRANGELIIRAHDIATWQFPEFHGRVAVRGSDFHFWDATDDILGADLDLLFEKDRLYLHHAQGRFGAVSMSLTGDLDLDPLTGHYRLSATVPGVEANALRATLGVRPTPFPVTGAVSGILHVTGPLEHPVFSGHAHVIRPSQEMSDDCEPSAALTALQDEPSAVGAYDKVPFSEAQLVFSLDTDTEIMTLHAFKAVPVGGGTLQGAGQLSVSPESEMDPAALSVAAQGIGIPAESIIWRYLPEGSQLPPGLIVGPASVNLTMQGAHLSPVIDAMFSLPESSAQGSVRFTRDSTSLSLSSPNMDASGTVFLQPPSFESIKSAVTQAQATSLAKPNITGCETDVTFRGFDIVPFISDEAALRQLTQQSGEPLRLRVHGRTKFAGTVFTDASNGDGTSPWHFDGTFDLENLKLNQLKLYRALKGQVKLGTSAVSMHARGLRADETLDVDFALPLFPQVALEAGNPAEAAQEKEGIWADGDHATLGSSLSARCGQLLMTATMDAPGSLVEVRVANVHLDELELASLRGELQEVSCSLNFKAQTGRGRVSLTGPRYSGLSGESLSGGVRWERDVIRLEKMVLQQRQSRYEIQGEYVVPPTTKLPRSAADLASRRQQENQNLQATGRWRLRMDVPSADMQEILPAARLLQSAASLGPADYERAKTAFITSVTDLYLRAQDLNAQLRTLTEKGIGIQSPAATNAASRGQLVPSGLQLPALQDARGQWSGSIQAFGGGGGATSCEYDVRGHAWQWGDAALDAVVAKGSYHSEEGVQLQELVLKAGDAKLLVRGSLLNDHQNATILLTDFPVTTLRPMFRAIPALKNAAPAVSSKVPDPIPSPLPLGMLSNALNQASVGLQVPERGTDSPINGLLYVSGTLGGSVTAPTGEVAVRVYEAAVGSTRLAQAQASARLTENMQLTFNVDVVPVEGHRKSGHIRASGSLPFLPEGAAATVGDAPESSAGPMDVRLSVRDSGMTVLTSMTPDFRWESGEADVSFRLSGRFDAPTVTGTALVNKAIIECPFLKSPLNIVTADVRCADGMLEVESLDARVGRKGYIRGRGLLPIYQSRQPKRGAAPVLAAMHHRITMDVQGLELRIRNLYTGQLDALVTVRDSVEHPVVGGSLRFSRGSIYLIPQGQDISAATSGSGSAVMATATSSLGAPLTSPSVAKVFDLLTRRESGLAAQLEDAVRQEVEAVEHIVEDAAGPNVVLDALALQFGPDLRATYPLVMNFALAGELLTSGPAHPDTVAVEGVLRLPGGEVNLVAAQLELDREHANTLTFGGAGAPLGVDPLVDLVLTSGELRVSVLGRASEWADHLVMQSVGGGSARGDAAEELDANEAARLLETKLKAALLADDGQLALSRLAGSTVSTLMPKIETQGSVGGTRWRLVSAPAIPGLLDPLLSDPSNLLGSITMGTEVEVQFGRKLQAAMVRKLRDSDITTQWTLNYSLNSKLRMQFNISSAPPYPKTLMFQYSSEGSG